MRIFKILELVAITVLVLVFIANDISRPSDGFRNKFASAKIKATTSSIIAVR